MSKQIPSHSAELEFLLTRASCDSLVAPAPAAGQLKDILSAALRAPDHGKIRPFRYLVISGTHREAFAHLIVAAMRKAEPETPDKKVEKRFRRFSETPMTIVLGMHPVEGGKIPVWEQEMTVGAGAMNVLNALHAEGFGGMWVSGDYMNERGFLDALGFSGADRIVGFLFVGTPESASVLAKRPDIARFMAHWDGAPASFGADQ